MGTVRRYRSGRTYAWAHYAACAVCNAQAGEPCVSTKAARAGERLVLLAPHRGRYSQAPMRPRVDLIDTEEL